MWKTYEDIDLNADVFPSIGEAFEQQHPVIIGQVGSATARLFRQRPAVDFAQHWLTEQHHSSEKLQNVCEQERS